MHVRFHCRLTFSRVLRKKSTEEFSCIPYILALLNCLLYTWYGLPVVSYRWENFPVVTINGVGIVLELSFILIYFWFASPRRKASSSIRISPLPFIHIMNFACIYTCLRVHVLSQVTVAVTTVSVASAFSIFAIISAFVFHDHHLRKVFIGSIGLVASVAMYGSPLVAVVSRRSFLDSIRRQ